jgi:hypothetical protein
MIDRLGIWDELQLVALLFHRTAAATQSTGMVLPIVRNRVTKPE